MPPMPYGIFAEVAREVHVSSHPEKVMKKKPTLEDEAKRLYMIGYGPDALPWCKLDAMLPGIRAAWLRLARHVRRREQAAFRAGKSPMYSKLR